MASDEALYNTLFNGSYINPIQPLWLSYTSTNITGPDIAVSTLTVNPYTAGNILLQSDTVSGTEYRAPLIFQRPVGDINAPSESLQMNLSVNVPTYPVDGEFITATKAGGTAYDDIAVKGLQIFGDQTTSGNAGAAAYITGSNGNLILSPHDSVYISSLFVSTLTANTIISTSATTGTSLTLTSFLSSATVITGNISTNSISTSQIVAKNISSSQIVASDIFTSTLTVSTLNAPNFIVSTINTSNISSVLIDTKVTLTSTLTLFGISSVSLGLGDVIQGLVGGAASQGLGAVLGGAALATGVAALVTGRTSGGVNSNVFQTVNGSTQLQFSTIGAAVSSVFLTTDSALPLTTPGVPIRQEIGVPAGTLCIRSVGDPLNITDNISAIQMFGQWVPVPGGGGSNFTIPSSIFLSTVNVDGNLVQSGNGTFNWGGNTMSPTQVVLARPTSVNNTLTTTGGAFLNAGATVNAGLTVASGTTNLNAGLNVNSGATQMTNTLTVFGQVTAQSGILVNGGNAQFNGPALATNTFSVSGLATLNGGVTSPTLNTTTISTANVNLSTINGALYPPPSAPAVIPSSIFLSTVNVNGSFVQSGTGTFNWGGNTMSPTQVVLSRPTSINNTLTTTGTAFMNNGASVNNGLTVGGGINASGFASFNSGANVTAGLTVGSGNFNVNLGTATFQNVANFNSVVNVFGPLGAQGGIQINSATAQFNGPTIANGGITTNNINLTSINGVPYSPGGGGSIPSTLQASTITFNGGLSNIGSAPLFSPQINATNINTTNTITSVNVNATNMRANDFNLSNNGGTITGNGQMVFQLAPGAAQYSFRNSAGTNTSYIAEFYANQTSRFFSTLTIRDTTFPIIGPSFARVQTYDPSYDSQPWGSVLTANLSTTTAFFNTGFTNLLNAASISSVNTSALNMAASNVTASNKVVTSQFVTRDGTNFMSFLHSNVLMFDVGLDLNSDIPGSYTFEMTPFQTNLGIIKATTLQTYFANIPGSPFTPAGRIYTSSISTVTTNALTLNANIVNTGFIRGAPADLVFRLGSPTGVVRFEQSSGNIQDRIMEMNNDKTTRFYSTLLVRDTTWPNPLPSGAAIKTYDGNDPVPYGSVITANMSTLNINVSTINNAPYPPPASIVPTGAIFMWSGVTVGSVPFGWLVCDGSLVSATTYANLFAVIGNSYTKYPNVPVAGSFYLPDLTYAIPQNPPTPTYAVTITVKSFTGALINYPFPTGTNALWEISGFPTNTLNVGTVFPAAQIPGAAYDIYIDDIITLQSSAVGDTSAPPSLVRVLYAPPGTAVLPNIPTNITITSAGAVTTPGTTYWKPGTYNTASTGNPNPWNSPQIYNLYNRLYAGQIPPHQHFFGGPNAAAPPGGGAVFPINVGPQDPVQNPTTIQTNAFSVSTLTLTPPMLYPTMPNIINMYYIIKA